MVRDPVQTLLSLIFIHMYSSICIFYVNFPLDVLLKAKNLRNRPYLLKSDHTYSNPTHREINVSH